VCVSVVDENERLKQDNENKNLEIELLKKDNKNVTINNNTFTSNNNSNNINITMNGYNKETYSHIDFESLRTLWKEVFPDYGEFVRKFVILAHKDNPNLKITNLRSNTALEYNGSKYESVPMDDAINRCLENVAKCLDENIPLSKKMLRMQLSTRLNDIVDEKYLDYSDDEEKQEELEIHKKCNNGIKNGLYKPKS
jgi:hypothetical protein